jgi:hypothetical protein
MVQKIIRDKLVTDNRQTDIFEPTLIHMGNLIFFFCVWEGENEWGEIYTSLLTTQVRFAHLLRSQGDEVGRTLGPNGNLIGDHI